MQSPTYDVIAEERFDSVFPGISERVPVRVWVAKPYTTDDGLGACPCGLDGLDKRRSDVLGEQPMQALGLAMSYVLSILEHMVESGKVVLFHPGTPEVVTLRELPLFFGFPQREEEDEDEGDDGARR